MQASKKAKLEPRIRRKPLSVKEMFKEMEKRKAVQEEQGKVQVSVQNLQDPGVSAKLPGEKCKTQCRGGQVQVLSDHRPSHNSLSEHNKKSDGQLKLSDDFYVNSLHEVSTEVESNCSKLGFKKGSNMKNWHSEPKCIENSLKKR